MLCERSVYKRENKRRKILECYSELSFSVYAPHRS